MILETEILRNKIKFISKMAKLQKTLRFIELLIDIIVVFRENNEQIVKLKGMCPDNKIPKGLLLEGGSAIKDGLFCFWGVL